MKIRGMEVVGAKLSKGEVTKKLKKLFSMKMHGGLSHRWAYGMRIPKKQIEAELDEILERKAKQKPPQAEYVDILDSVIHKDNRKKFKTKPTKCWGTSRKKCPKCKDKGKVKIWLGDYGKKKELLCIRCGWTTRAVTTIAYGFRA